MTHNESIRVVMDAANEILSVYAAKDIEIEAGNHLGIQTEMFTLSADNAISIEAGDGIVVESGSVIGVVGGSRVQIQSPDVLIN